MGSRNKPEAMQFCDLPDAALCNGPRWVRDNPVFEAWWNRAPAILEERAAMHAEDFTLTEIVTLQNHRPFGRRKALLQRSVWIGQELEGSAGKENVARWRYVAGEAQPAPAAHLLNKGGILYHGAGYVGPRREQRSPNLAGCPTEIHNGRRAWNKLDQPSQRIVAQVNDLAMTRGSELVD